MNRTTRIAVAAGGAVALMAVVLISANVAGASTGSAPGAGATARPSPPSSSPSSSPIPSALPTEPGEKPQDPAAVDPYYGDVVVANTTDDPAEFASGLTVELVSVTDTSAAATGIGSTGGPAVEVTLLVTNTSGASITLSPAVNAYAGSDRVPLTPDHETPIADTIASSAQSTGSYTFAVDDETSSIWITVSTGPDSGLVVFEYRR